MVYLPTFTIFCHSKSTIHVGKYTIYMDGSPGYASFTRGDINFHDLRCFRSTSVPNHDVPPSGYTTGIRCSSGTSQLGGPLSPGIPWGNLPPRSSNSSGFPGSTIRTESYMGKSTLIIARYCPLVMWGFSCCFLLFQVIMANPGSLPNRKGSSSTHHFSAANC